MASTERGAASGRQPSTEHRWTIPCELDPDGCSHVLGPIVRAWSERAADRTAFEQVDTGGFFGWTLRQRGAAVGIAVPQPGEPEQLRVRSMDEALGRSVVEHLTGEGEGSNPLAGRDARYEAHELVEGAGP